jgi:hypothetical protein
VKREAVERDEERESSKRGRERTDGMYGRWSDGRGSGGVQHGKAVCVYVYVCVVVGEEREGFPYHRNYTMTVYTRRI